MFESKSGVLLIAGIGFFALAFVSNALVPMLMYSGDKFREQTAFEAVNDNTVRQMEELKRFWPQAFKTHLGDFEQRAGLPEAELTTQLKAQYPNEFEELPKDWATRELSEKERFLFRFPAAELLREGRRWYIGEGCWHCHSQFIRPVSQEDKRWGAVSKGWEYQNELQRPVMFGTRRVGPDLSRAGGRRSTDWHAVHLYYPKSTSPYSVMPAYSWYFEPLGPEKDRQLKSNPGEFSRHKTQGERDKEQKVDALTMSIEPVPNRRGMALLLYIQWLGSWLPDYPYYDSLDRRKQWRTHQ